MIINKSQLHQWIKERRHIMVFTGAGASADSGIPTFRYSDHSLWTGVFGCFILPIFGTKTGWSWLPWFNWVMYRRFFWNTILHAKPNACHRYISDLNSSGQHWVRIITQNVDGLHQRAGTPPEHVAEIHGTVWNNVCSNKRCGEPIELVTPFPNLVYDESKSVPHCRECGSPPRPDVTLFGEMPPQTAHNQGVRFINELEDCEKKDVIVLMIGMSGQVDTVFNYLWRCKEICNVFVLIDPKPTNRMLEFATHVIQDTAEHVFQ